MTRRADDPWSQVSKLYELLKPFPRDRQDAALIKMREGGESPEVLSVVEFWLRELPEWDRDRSGETIGAYTLDKRIGGGGMGEVYLARRTAASNPQGDDISKPVAVKLIRWPRSVSVEQRRLQVDRFKKEIEILCGLTHTHVARIDRASIEPVVDCEENLSYLAMEFVEDGMPITVYVTQYNLRIQDILDIMIKVCKALSDAHDHGVIHRDLKPENILVGSDGEPRVIDFGLAKLVGDPMPRGIDLVLSGTPKYMSPEQVTDAYGDVSVRSDVYALGIILYELLAGRPPYEMPLNGNSVRHAILGWTWVPLRSLNRDCSQRLEQAIARATEKDPKKRYASAGPLRAELEKCLEEARSATPEKTIWLVPREKNAFFTGREKECEMLRHELVTKGRAALSGLGGVGKTQTALWYAYHFGPEYKYVFWCDAASQDVLYRDAASIARELSLPMEDKSSIKEITAFVKQWLQQNDGWLLVLDNADEPDVLCDLFPEGGRGHLLLTSRQCGIGNRIQQILKIEGMDLENGALFLLRRTRRIAWDAPLEAAAVSDIEQAKKIVDDMHGLPLALDQAAAFVDENASSFEEYRKLYQSYGDELRRERGFQRGDYPESVATTWLISFRKVEESNRAAADLLKFCAFLGPDAIPEEIFTAGPTHLGEYLGPAAANPRKFLEAIKEARRYSLLDRNPDAKILHIHRLVQLVQIDWMDKTERRCWAERVIHVMDQSFPKPIFERWTSCDRLIIHALTAADHVDHWDFQFPAVIRMLGHTAAFLMARGQHAPMERLAERALEVAERTLGSDHLVTLGSRDVLASAYLATGCVGHAIKMAEETLRVGELQLGADHLHTMQFRNNLGRAYSDGGRTAEAIELFEGVLGRIEARLGSSHPDVLLCRGNLASAYRDAGRTQDAIEMNEAILRVSESQFGPVHPNTIQFRNNLAAAYLAAGRVADASLLLKEAVKLNESQLGLVHRHTLTCRNNLGECYLATGRIAGAIELHEETLRRSEAHLGPVHPNTLVCRHNLAKAYLAAGHIAEAIELHEETLKRSEAHLGSVHPHPRTLTRLGSLASAYLSAGRIAEAIELHKETLKRSEAQLGPVHPHTLTFRHNLASAFLAADRIVEAIKLHEETLKQSEVQLGPVHPDTLTRLDSLASAYLAAGRTAEAIVLHEETLKRSEACLGPVHPNTVTFHLHLAKAYHVAGRTGDSLRMNEVTLRLSESQFGPVHPKTLACRNNLGEDYLATGCTAEAMKLREETLRLMEAHLGPVHPETLASRNNLGQAYLAAGCTAEAIELHEESLRLREAHLGPVQSHTLSIRHNLAKAYLAAGRTAEAIELHEKTLELFESHLGPVHPHTLASRGSLALAYLAAGRTAEAMKLHEETLRLSESHLGPVHPHTLIFRHNLGEVYLAAGRTAEAIELHEETLELFESHLGPVHPHTLTSRGSLGLVYLTAGRTAEAIKLLEQALKLFELRLGPVHPDTLTCRKNLAAAHQAARRTSDGMKHHLEEGHSRSSQLIRATQRAERNDTCPCGSGKKYKKCCMRRDRQP
jgi:serine/threonine protein kinase/tetratricopeptide (TPR) repeat protein